MKNKKMMEWTKTHTNVDYADNVDYELAEVNSFWRDFSSLPCHIVFKDLPKLIICC